MTEINGYKIAPPPELVSQWRSEPEYWDGTPGKVTLHSISEPRLFQLLTRSAQWGADQELEACVAWLADEGWDGFAAEQLWADRRPKPPSLKEQALEELGAFEGMGTCNIDTIRRALEALPDD